MCSRGDCRQEYVTHDHQPKKSGFKAFSSLLLRERLYQRKGKERRIAGTVNEGVALTGGHIACLGFAGLGALLLAATRL